MRDLINTTTCPNCGHEPFTTHYCPECGQKKLEVRDLRISALFSEFVQGFLNFENSFLKTLRAFFTAPSKFVEEYNHGARRKYISPIKWFLLANAVYFLLPAINTFTTTLEIQMNGLFYSDLTNQFIRNRVEASGMEFSAYASEYNQLTATLSKALLIILPVLFSVITWISDLKNKKKAPFIFHINHSLVFHAFMLLIVLSVVPYALYMIAVITQAEFLLNSLTEIHLTTFSLIALNAYGFFVYRKLLKARWWVNVIRIIALNMIFSLLIFVYRFILLLSTLGWMAAFR